MKMAHLFVPAMMVALTLLFFGNVFAQEDLPTFSAGEFWQAFEDDRQKAEKEFIGKTMNFTGVVVETGMSIYLTPNVRLSDAVDGPIYLICVLPRADTATLSTYNTGDRVTMTGRVYRSKSGGGVVIKECRRAGK